MHDNDPALWWFPGYRIRHKKQIYCMRRITEIVVQLNNHVHHIMLDKRYQISIRMTFVPRDSLRKDQENESAVASMYFCPFTV